MERRILIVDDEEHMREYVRDLLAGQRYAFAIAPGFETAVRLASGPGARFDLLLTDILIPPFHGRDLANRIMGLHAGIRVLFMSGHPPRMLREHGLLPAGAPFLSKPFNQPQLLEALEAASQAAPTWIDLVSAPKEG